MNRSTTTAALLVLAAAMPAMAQGESVTVHLTHNDADSTILVGESVTWSLEIAFEGFPEGSIASGIDAVITASSPALVSSSSLDYNPWLSGSTGGDSDGAGGIDWVNIFNSHDPGFGGTKDSSNPLPVGSFITTALSQGVLTYDLSKALGAGAFVTIDYNLFLAAVFSESGDVTFNIDSLNIVPAPASALLLAPVALIAARRRRA